MLIQRKYHFWLQNSLHYQSSSDDSQQNLHELASLQLQSHATGLLLHLLSGPLDFSLIFYSLSELSCLHLRNSNNTSSSLWIPLRQDDPPHRNVDPDPGGAHLRDSSCSLAPLHRKGQGLLFIIVINKKSEKLMMFSF